MAVAFAFSDPLLGGAGFETNTDFKLPLVRVHKASPPSITSRDSTSSLPKLAYLSSEDISGDSGYYGSVTAGSSRQDSVDYKISPRLLKKIQSETESGILRSAKEDDEGIDNITSGITTVRLDHHENRGLLHQDEEDEEEYEDSTDEYDTELEPEDELPKRIIDLEKNVGQATYLWACEDIGTAPQQQILNNLAGQEIQLSGRNLGSKGIVALSLALKKNARVIHLDVSDNGMGPEGAAHLASALTENEFILTVDASLNQMGKIGAVAIGDMLKHNRGIRKLNISRNDFDEDAAKFIGLGLELNERLEELDLSYNCFCELGGTALGKALEKNDSIEKLNISHNHIRRSGGVAILKALQTNYAVTHLNISYNGIGYEGALALSEMLKVNRYMLEVDARHCRINWQGALLIANGIRYNSILEVLKLGGNPVTTTGAMDLIEAIGSMTCVVRHFDLSEVMVIYEFEMLAKAISQTREFQYVHGGIVNSHDIIGQRLEKRIEPMQRVMDYMKERELRPTELFRSFDKAVKSKLTKKQFAARIQQSGIPVPSWEIDELLETLTNTVNGDPQINYQNLADSVSKYVEKERQEKIKEREDHKKREELHNKIMNPALFNPMLAIMEDETSLLMDPLASTSSMAITSSLFKGPHNSTLSRVASVASIGSGSGAVTAASMGNLPPLVKGASQPKIMSMSTTLGGKVKEFGTAGVKKKKKKKKKVKKR